tara:strand:+ start:5633 stop:6619 length:987 start_codon:yes stop_codon:yes gene_type:complete
MSRPCCLVLSGAGGRLPYLFAIGSEVKKALKEKDIEIAAYAGDSAGAIVGAWLASDTEFEDLTIFDEKDNLSRHIRIGGSILRVISHAWSIFKNGGILNSSKVFSRAVSKPNFFPNPINSPCYVNVYSLTQGREIVANLQDLGDGWKGFVMGSCCIPAVFSPFPFHEKHYPDYIKNTFPPDHELGIDLQVDGGIASYFPVDFPLNNPELMKRNPLIIGVILDDPKPGHNHSVASEPFHRKISRSCTAAITANIHEDIADVLDAGLDLEIAYIPTPDEYSNHRIKFHLTKEEATEFYMAGAETARKQIPDLLRRVEAKLVLGNLDPSRR